MNIYLDNKRHTLSNSVYTCAYYLHISEDDICLDLTVFNAMLPTNAHRVNYLGPHKNMHNHITAAVTAGSKLARVVGATATILFGELI